MLAVDPNDPVVRCLAANGGHSDGGTSKLEAHQERIRKLERTWKHLQDKRKGILLSKALSNVCFETGSFFSDSVLW